MNKNELKEVLRLHQLWLEGNPGGERANLEGANLEGINLKGANLVSANLAKADLKNAYLGNAHLEDANLIGSNLEGANISRANLVGANLSRAYLKGANLKGANLKGANLEGADLENAKLWNAIGNGKEIRTIQTEYCIVNITKDIVQIGCEAYTWKQWLTFTDVEIFNLDGQKALEFWNKYKDYIQLSIDLTRF